MTRNLSRTRELRRASTTPERLLWSMLRNRKLGGLKFRRQHSFGPYIVDFYCEEKKLVVEVDGESHEGREHYDERRQKYLEEIGLRVIRVFNDDILDDVEPVAIAIANAAGIKLKW